MLVFIILIDSQNYFRCLYKSCIFRVNIAFLGLFNPFCGMDIGTKIRKVRELKGIPMKEMAEKLGMAISGYSKIERGEVNINIDKLTEIATVMELTPEELMSFDDKIVFQNSTLTNFAFNNGQFHYNFPEKLQQLYEDKIKLLEEKNEMLKAEIDRLKNK